MESQEEVAVAGGLILGFEDVSLCCSDCDNGAQRKVREYVAFILYLFVKCERIKSHCLIFL